MSGLFTNAPRAGNIMNEKVKQSTMRGETKQSALGTISSSLYSLQVGVFVNKLQTESN